MREEGRRTGTFSDLSSFVAHPFFAPLDIEKLFGKAFNLANKVTEFVGVSYW